MPEFHPLSELFPLMTSAEFDALAADVAEHGLREPIILLDDKILDGRNRYRACEAAKIEPIYQDWDNSNGDPRAFVVSKNLHRRHLNESQRAMIAAKLFNTKSGDNRYTIQAAGIPVTTRAEAAAMLNVHHTTVSDAKKVLNDGTPEQIAAIERGKTSVSTVANQIRGSAPIKKKNRDAPISQSGRNPERIQRRQISAEIWGRLRDSLTNLTSLPLPAEVIPIVGENDRTGLVDARLAKSIQWLKDFQDARSNG